MVVVVGAGFGVVVLAGLVEGQYSSRSGEVRYRAEARAKVARQCRDEFRVARGCALHGRLSARNRAVEDPPVSAAFDELASITNVYPEPWVGFEEVAQMRDAKCER